MMEKIRNKIHNLDSVEKSGLVSLAIKPISILLSLAYTPLLISCLGDERYGLWATILSIITWINYFDVGIGNGLRNCLTRDLTNNDHRNAKRLISTAYIILTLISLVLLVIALSSIRIFDWKKILSTNIEINPTLAITFSFICINFILALVNTILYALQMAEKVAIRNCLIQLINIALVLLLTRLKENKMEFIAIIFGLSTLIVNSVSTILIMNKLPFLKPSIKDFSRSAIPEICNKGMQFFIIQIMCLLMFTMDNLIITHFFGPTSVTPFSVANKVYNTGYSFLAAFLVPYWSGTTSAYESKDIKWIKNSILKIKNVLIIFAVGCILFTFIYDKVIYLWLGRQMDYDSRLPFIMCVFYILYGILAVECQFINGSGKLRVQLIMYIILGIANIPLSIYMGVQMGMGSYGVRLATTVLVFIADIVLGINLRNILKEV